MVLVGICYPISWHGQQRGVGCGLAGGRTRTVSSISIGIPTSIVRRGFRSEGTLVGSWLVSRLAGLLAQTTTLDEVLGASWRTHQDCVVHLDCHPIFYWSTWRWLMDDDAWIPRFLLSRIRLGPGVLDELGKGGREMGQRPLEFGIGFGGSCFGSTREGNGGEWREGKATTFRVVLHWLWTWVSS